MVFSRDCSNNKNMILPGNHDMFLMLYLSVTKKFLVDKVNKLRTIFDDNYNVIGHFDLIFH